MATMAINLQQEGYIPVSIDAAEAAQRLLRECTSNRMVHVTRLLAVDGVDVNVRDPEGRTPIHVAAEHGVATVVEALVEAGGDVELRAADGTPPVLARAAKESEIPNFKGSYLGRFPLVLADFWTSDHLSERSRSVDAVSGTRARGTLTLKRR